MAYKDKPDYHRHECPECGFVWEHSDECRNTCTQEEFHKLHKCPECGERQSFKYSGVNAPGKHPPQETEDVLGP